MLKKTFSFLLTLAVFATLFLSIAAVSGNFGNGLHWDLNTETGLLVISGNGPMPEGGTTDSYPFRSYLSQIKSVVIEQGVSTIGDYAFYQCSNLKSITIPYSVTVIGKSSLSECGLESLTIPHSVSNIHSASFAGNQKLTSVSFLPNALITFSDGNGGDQFENCVELTTFNYPGLQQPTGVTNCDKFFGGCNKLTSMNVRRPFNGEFCGRNLVENVGGLLVYDVQGGVANPENPPFFYNNVATTVKHPTKKGYDFIGWSGTLLTGIVKDVTIPENSAGDRSYTAHWELAFYNITYDLQGGVVNPENPSNYTVETAVTLNQPTKQGYEFAGWTGTDLTGMTKDVTIPVGSAGDRHYTAHWKDENSKTSETSLSGAPKRYELSGVVLAAIIIAGLLL